ncbi:MAG TPA: hypothetical protein VHA07_05145 [Devosia sp.]|nr:hypothetical protein [Devosia sp.]
MPRPIHFEIHADDLRRARGFYEALFGWTFTEYMPDFYHLITTGPEGEPGINGGLVKRQGGQGDRVVAFVCTIGVPDLDAAIAKFKSLDGRVALDKHAIPKVGWNFYGKDTEDNIFGMHQPDPNAA